MLSFLVQAASAPEVKPIDFTPGSGFGGLANLQFAGLISGIITFFLIAAAIVFFFILVIGGIKWILSQGEEAKVKAARDQVTHALIGLVVVFAAWAIINLIAYAFDLKLSNLTFPKFITP